MMASQLGPLVGLVLAGNSPAADAETPNMVLSKGNSNGLDQSERFFHRPFESLSRGTAFLHL
jgi:hypothetical protein